MRNFTVGEIVESAPSLMMSDPVGGSVSSLTSLLAQAPALVAPKVRRGHAAGDRGVGISTNATATVVPHNVVTQIRLRSPDGYPIPAIARDRVARDERLGTQDQQEAVALAPADEIPRRVIEELRASRPSAVLSTKALSLNTTVVLSSIYTPWPPLTVNPLRVTSFVLRIVTVPWMVTLSLPSPWSVRRLMICQVLLVGASLDLDGIALRGDADGLLDLCVLAALRADGDRPLSQTDGST
jgi:hypothetical protein